MNRVSHREKESLPFAKQRRRKLLRQHGGSSEEKDDFVQRRI
jgi:hypothetical protein